MALPSEITAVVTTESGVPGLDKVTMPTIREDYYMLVRVTAVALNPVDWKRAKTGEENPGHRLGCDYAGIVEQVGSKVTKSFRPGDRVCGVAHGGNPTQPEDGSFGEYIVVKGDVQIKTPDTLSDEEAASLGVGITTAGQGLYQSLKLTLPSIQPAAPEQQNNTRQKPLVFIYGGSTATGILGVQFASLSGYTVITTSSPSNFDYLKSLGASLVVDYNSPTAIQELNGWVTNNTDDGALTKVWDCIGGPSASRFCALVLANPPPAQTKLQYSTIAGADQALVKSINRFVDHIGFTLAFTAVGEPLGGKGPQSLFGPQDLAADFEFAKMFWELSRELLAQGKIKPARIDVNRGGKGLEGVLYGLKEMELGKVSGVKLVYTLSYHRGGNGCKGGHTI